jgi:hypothetical protein
MVAANLIARTAHGRYAVVRPFVRELWRGQSALGAPESDSRAAGGVNGFPTITVSKGT